MTDGSIQGDLLDGKPFAGRRWADDPELGIDLPGEARLMLDRVRQDPVDQVVAAFDLHQDYVTEGLGPCSYQYAFGDLSRYDDIVARVHEVVPPLAGLDMAGGFGEQIDEKGNVLPRDHDNAVRSDEKGFIVRYDSTFSDHYQRIGVTHSIATETSGATPMEDACRGELDLAHRCDRPGRRLLTAAFKPGRRGWGRRSSRVGGVGGRVRDGSRVDKGVAAPGVGSARVSASQQP